MKERPILFFHPFDVPRFDQFEWRVKPENFVFEECVYVLKKG